MYGISTTKGYLKSSEIIAMLDSSIPLQNAHIQSIRNLEANLCRYSNEDCDVLGAALAAVGKVEIAEYNQRWVEVMNEQSRKAQ